MLCLTLNFVCLGKLQLLQYILTAKISSITYLTTHAHAESFQHFLLTFLFSLVTGVAHRSHFWCLQMQSSNFCPGCLIGKDLHTKRCRIQYELPFIMPINV